MIRSVVRVIGSISSLMLVVHFAHLMNWAGTGPGTFELVLSTAGLLLWMESEVRWRRS